MSQRGGAGARPPRGRGQFRQMRGRGGPGRGGQHRSASTRTPAVPAMEVEEGAKLSNGISNVPQVAATGTRFRDIPGLSPILLQSLPFEFCTEVQAATLPDILTGHDVLAQAKTGTGKTIAFLLPSIQRLLSMSPPPPPTQTSILVLSPTRELAHQIAVAAEGLLETSAGGKGKGKQYGVQSVVGGTNIKTDLSRFRTQRSDVLIATPGRLLDLIGNEGIGGRFAQLQTLVLDEADRLLDQGFRQDLTKIIKALPQKSVAPRQTLLFSATIPDAVHSMASLALDPNHKFISTLKEEDLNVHEQVMQEKLIVPGADILAATYEALQREYSLRNDRGGFKVMVFLPTARSAAIYHDVFAQVSMPAPVWEVHSRMSQSARTKATEAFRVAPMGVLFSSDVTARGLDVKGVTAVIQVGLPSSAEQYIHRLGRTARAGAQGHGILILADFETHFLRDKTIATLPIQPYTTPSSSTSLQSAHQVVNRALQQGVTDEAKAQAYQAWMGYYNSSLRALGWNKEVLVQQANEYARTTLGYDLDGQRTGRWSPPGMLAKVVGKMGLKGTPGLNVIKGLPPSGAPGGQPKGEAKRKRA